MQWNIWRLAIRQIDDLRLTTRIMLKNLNYNYKSSIIVMAEGVRIIYLNSAYIYNCY